MGLNIFDREDVVNVICEVTIEIFVAALCRKIYGMHVIATSIHCGN